MGDRSSIIIRQENGTGIEIYGHWAGLDIVNNLPKALCVAQGRYDDEQYFNRIIIQNILNSIASEDSSLGAGIGITSDYKESTHWDLGYHPVIVDPIMRVVIIGDRQLYFEDINEPADDVIEADIVDGMKAAMTL